MLRTLFGGYAPWVVEGIALVLLLVGFAGFLMTAHGWEWIPIAGLAGISALVGGIAMSLPAYIYLTYKWRRLMASYYILGENVTEQARARKPGEVRE